MLFDFENATIKEYIKQNPNISEEKLIRYVYLDLGQRFSFDLRFAFGNTKTRRNIYTKSKNKEKKKKKREWKEIVKRRKKRRK